MYYRNKSSQVNVATKVGISERIARRIDSDKHETKNNQEIIFTRKALLNCLFEKYLVPLFEALHSQLQPITKLDVLEEINDGTMCEWHCLRIIYCLRFVRGSLQLGKTSNRSPHKPM